jgi:hypothetical protein
MGVSEDGSTHTTTAYPAYGLPGLPSLKVPRKDSLILSITLGDYSAG